MLRVQSTKCSVYAHTLPTTTTTTTTTATAAAHVALPALCAVGTRRCVTGWSSSAGSEVYAFGRGLDGQLGLGSQQVQPSPVFVDELSHFALHSVHAGVAHSIAITDTGRVLSWGDNFFSQAGADADKMGDEAPLPVECHALSGHTVVGGDCGYFHSVVVSDDGDVMCWGANPCGQLGKGDFVNDGYPHIVDFSMSGGSGFVSTSTYSERIVSVAAGGFHTLALGEEGGVYGWGRSKEGQLGDDLRDKIHVTRPVKLQLPGVRGALVGLAGGRYHSAFITDSKELVVLGGACMRDTLRPATPFVEFPRMLATPPDVRTTDNKLTKVVAGAGLTVALTDTGVVLAHCNSDSPWAFEPSKPFDSTAPALYALGGGGVVDVAVGATHIVLSTRSGDVHTAGVNDFGQLGIGLTDPFEPQPFSKVEDVPAGTQYAVTAGYDYTFLLKSGA